MSFFKELKCRNVFRVGIAYTVATWLLIQVTDTVFPRIGLPDSAVMLVIALLAIGQYRNNPDMLKPKPEGRMDARIGGTLALSEAVKGCMCGAPFDLESTPNYKQRIEEAGFNWPPVSPIKYPAKDW